LRGRIIHSEADAGGPGEWKEIHAPANLKALDLDAGKF
jgi:hypothetical protein